MQLQQQQPRDVPGLRSTEGAVTASVSQIRPSAGNLEGAVNQTAKFAFDAADANDNRQLTEEEAAVAMGSVVRRLGIPEARQN